MARSLGQLRDALGAALHGDPARVVSRIADLSIAGCDDLTLLTDSSRLDEALRCRAAAFVVRRHFPELDAPQLVCADVGRALGRLLESLLPVNGPVSDASAAIPAGIDPRAAVAPDVEIHPSARIGPFAYLGPGARIGAGATIEPFTYVGAGTVVGAQCRLGPSAIVMEGCALDEAVVVGPGAVVGHDGFGLYRDQPGGELRRIPSRGTVRLGPGVEVGANSCIDRGTLAATVVGAGAKLDNLVQVGHNAVVGERVILCAQVGLAGSVHVDDDSLLGGQVGVADHRRIGRGAQVGARSGVASDVPDGARVSGYPAISHSRWLRASVLFARLSELAREVRQLGQRLKLLTDDAGEAQRKGKGRSDEA